MGISNIIKIKNWLFKVSSSQNLISLKSMMVLICSQIFLKKTENFTINVNHVALLKFKTNFIISTKFIPQIITFKFFSKLPNKIMREDDKINVKSYNRSKSRLNPSSRSKIKQFHDKSLHLY